MRWFGFGFNAFGQICAQKEKSDEGEANTTEVKIISPTELSTTVDGSGCSFKTRKIQASWSRRVSLRGDGDRCVFLAGFKSFPSAESSGCTDAFISESHLTLAFQDRIETWNLQEEDKTPSWNMEISAQPESSGVNLPLAPGGYITSKPPFYYHLSAQLKAKSLALGGGHAVLLTAAGDVYTWGLGSHGQLGHGGLASEEKPRVVEALCGMPMSSVASGGWHSACISDIFLTEGGDLYVWGWNESGQLGLPSRGLWRASQHKSSQQSGEKPEESGTSLDGEQQEEDKHEEVFISIQAFPALLDVSQSCEIQKVSCGSRHTAVVTNTGDLYTWGWGEYGQLGHQTLMSSDEPQRVEFFKDEQMRVIDVVCGTWNTFAAAIKKDDAYS
ncbi:RCC1 domain-containing protein 1 isoform 3-T3 [Pholidichthys leucotaenia]